MKIIQVMPDFGVAGAEIMAENLIYGLKQAGHDIVVVSFYNVHTVITERLEKNGVKIIYLNKTPGFDWSIFKKLRTVIMDNKPDIIHTHRYVLPYVCVAMCGKKRYTIIHTVHNIAEKEVGPKQLLLQKILFKKKNIIPVAISPIVRTSIINYYGIPDQKVYMVYNGIDLKQCNRKTSYTVKPPFSLLHVGRFSAQKNHETLIRSFSKVINSSNCAVKLFLLGDGELRPCIENIVSDLGLENNIEFLGISNKVYEIMNRCDAFILPSNYEGMPITLIEAMATGLPIVATRVGGVPDMIEDGYSGFLVNNDEDEICCAIKKLIESEETRAFLGNHAAESSKLFSKDQMTSNYLDIYQNNLCHNES